jgi:hypothetical protein
MKPRPLPSRAQRVSNIIHRGAVVHGFDQRPMDASRRRHIHGPLQPMPSRGFFARLFGRRL